MVVIKSQELQSLIDKLTNPTEWRSFQIVFFLGAGCSRSSGIPGAQELASRWLRELRKDPSKAGVFLGIEESKAGDHYFDIFLERFQPSERKGAIAAFTKAAYPGLGYSIFANLLSSSDKWGSCKTILTTNFDNLIEQAFILFTSERPLVIPEPSLIKHMGSKGSISVVKIHGDSRYEPKNDRKAVQKIPSGVRKKVLDCIDDGILIVFGYAGAEDGVAELISELIGKKRIKQIWWVDSKPPGQPIQENLPSNFEEFFHIKHADFDDFMLRLKHRIDVPHISAIRMDEHIYRYHDRLMWRLGLYGNDGQPKIAINCKHFDDYFRLFAEAALAFEKPEKDKALNILESGLKKHSQSANYNILLGAFHKTIMGDQDRAIELFRKATELAPDHSGARAELANILKEQYYPRGKSGSTTAAVKEVIDQFEEAERLDPLNINNELNYAGFLLALNGKEYNEGKRKLTKCAEKLYESKHRMELAFYVFAHNLEELGVSEHLKELRGHLKNGSRSPDFDLRWNVRKAEKDSHSYIDLVRNLAVAINSDPFTLPPNMQDSIDAALKELRSAL